MEAIVVRGVVPAAPKDVFAAWLDGERHAAMTGAPATCAPRPGGAHSAWGGYITGTNLEIGPGLRVLQTWRSSDFPEDAPDSRLEVQFLRDEEGTELVFRHTDIPDGQGGSYEQGWVDHYLEPMRAYFGG